MENKFKAGDFVFERIHPNQKMVVKKNIGKIYYCRAQEFPERKELVYFERDLISDIDIKNRNCQ